MDYLYLLLKLLIGFLIIILYLNFTGKTQVSQMNAIDLIGNFILGGIIGGVIYSPNISMLQFLICLFMAIAIIYSLNLLVKKTNVFRSFAIGKPIVLVKDGKFCLDAIKNKQNKVDMVSLASNLRILGFDTFSKVNFLQIEPNGQLSVRPNTKESCLPGYIFYVHGVLDQEFLAQIEKDEAWVMHCLKTAGIDSLEKVYLIELFEDKLFVLCQDGELKQIKY
ncbi:DUF421 domain-containing protein [Myroides sp. LJL116]